MTTLFDPTTQTPAAGVHVGVAPAAGTTPRAWTIDMPAPTAWLNANTRTDRRRLAGTIKTWRDAAHVWARHHKLPRLRRAHILITLRFGDRRRRDPGNWYPTAKAIVDGLIDHGLLPDDSSAYLDGPDLRVGEPVEHYAVRRAERVVVTITDLSVDGVGWLDDRAPDSARPRVRCLNPAGRTTHDHVVCTHPLRDDDNRPSRERTERDAGTEGRDVTLFLLGVHQPHWLAIPTPDPVPLFVSHRRLAGRRILPRAAGPWALDSGAFSELAMFGEFRTSPTEYVAAVRRYADEIGRLEWAAPQDHMCEPFMLAQTGGTIPTHQASTVDNLLRLRDLWGDGDPFIPVLQGWTGDDYARHVDAYDRAGVDLTAEPLVGVGSVCRRQHTRQIAAIVGRLVGFGLRLHGFGVKTRGLAVYTPYLASADSMAWSYEGRRTPGCTHGRVTVNEANCRGFALSWRDRVLDVLGRPCQLDLFAEAGGAA